MKYQLGPLARRAARGADSCSQLIRDEYRPDLLQIGAAGRLLLAGDIDEIHPAEDHTAWMAARPVDGVIDPEANERRERAIAERLRPGAVIILGAGHDLRKWIDDSIPYRIERVDTLPEVADYSCARSLP